MKKGPTESSQPNHSERFIEHLLKEIDRLHGIIEMLAPKITSRVLVDPLKELTSGKVDLFAEDPLQVEQFYKDMGLTPKDTNA